MINKEKIEFNDQISENILKIKDLFPNTVTESETGIKIDIDKLKEELSKDLMDSKEERYQMTWPGKKASIKISNQPTDKTLIPDRDSSFDFDNTQNIYIEGDNLEALKLLKKSYEGKIKCIYIDPPYNTGNDFVYKDDFKQSREDYALESGEVSEENERLVSNPETSGRYHSDWLSMMYPRLKLARHLLTEDGVIFISIDDNEGYNLKKISDEIYGEENNVAIIKLIVRYDNKSLNEKKPFQEIQEQVLVYTKDKKKILFNRPKESYSLDKFEFDISHSEAPSHTVEVNGRKMDIWYSDKFKIVKKDTPSTDLFKETWITGSIYSNTGHGTIYKKFIEDRVKEDGYECLYRIYGIGEDGLGYRYYTNPKEKKYNKGKMYTKIPTNILNEIEMGLNVEKENPIISFSDFSADFGNIRQEGGIPFNSGKKPIKMLKQLINYLQDPGKDNLILDFFSGSSSTAHAVMQLNSEDNGNRKYIMIQIPEKTPEDSEAYKAGFKNICEIGKERIRRAAKKIKEETNAEIDYGFKVFKVSDSIINPEIELTPNELLQNSLKFENIREGLSNEDLLYSAILKTGLPLDSKVVKEKISNNEFFTVVDSENNNILVACFDKDVNFNENIIKFIASSNPLRVYFRDSSFKSDSEKINFEQKLNELTSESVEIYVL